MYLLEYYEEEEGHWVDEKAVSNPDLSLGSQVHTYPCLHDVSI